MEFFKSQTSIPFLKYSPQVFAISVAVILIVAGLLATRGLNLGLDFTGGALIEVRYAQPADLNQVRATLAEAGHPDAVAQLFGSTQDVAIRAQLEEGADQAVVADQIVVALKGKAADLTVQRIEFVGPQIGDELVEKGMLAMIYTLIGILIYVALRFEWKYAVGAIAATVHDAVFVFGVFAVTGWTFDLTVLAAVLAVIGYSLNDTIVLFDRVRENFRLMRKATPYQVIEASVNQTLSRTIMTSLTTQLVVISLLVFGGDSLFGFAAALTVGIVVGTYSTVFIASYVALKLGANRDDLLDKEAENPADAVP